MGMKILVSEMPEFPRDCLFSKFNCEYGWLCKLFKDERSLKEIRQSPKTPHCDLQNCPYLQTT